MGRRTTAVVAAIVLAGTLGGAPAQSSGRASHIVVKPAKFGYLPRGWHAFQNDFGVLTRRGASVESYMLSWAYRPGPLGWRIPPRGIAVGVLLLRRGGTTNLCRSTPHMTGYPPIRRLPLRLPRTTSDRFEGSPNVLEYRVFGRMGDSYNVDLRVDVNSLHPTAAMLRTAQRVVNAIRFPTWPRLERC